MSKLLQFLLAGNEQASTVVDPLWNDVLLLMRLDDTTNSKGLPFYRDYSKYQHHLRYIGGSEPQTPPIQPKANSLTSNLPYIAPQNGVNVTSFARLDNRRAFDQATSDFNTETVNPSSPSYIEAKLINQDTFYLGTDDFTIEVSLYCDSVNLPWRYQTILAAGACLNRNWANLNDVLNTVNITSFQRFPSAVNSGGYGLFIQDNDIVFYADGSVYVIADNIQALTWQHIAIQRQGNILRTFLNGVETHSYVFNKALNNPIFINDDSWFFDTLRIGASFTYSSFGISYPVAKQCNMTAFSGGLSNLRITKAARYLGNFYTVNLPLALITNNQNKLDSNYSDVLINSPFTFDYFDYSPVQAHITDKELLKQAPFISSHGLQLHTDSYTTRVINQSLDTNEWCLEFNIVPYLNKLPLNLWPRYTSVEPAHLNYLVEDTLFQLIWYKLYGYSAYSGEDADEILPLLSLAGSDGSKLLDINFNCKSVSRGDFGNFGSYFSLKLSQNGTDWILFPSETSTALLASPLVTLPDEEIKFGGQFQNPTTIPTYSDVVRGAFAQRRLHIAVQRYNSSLYIFINGNLHKTIAFSGALHTPAQLKMQYGGDTVGIQGRPFVYSLQDNGTYQATTEISNFTLGISNVRLTNKARYSISGSNDIDYENSAQPLSLSTVSLPPARARVLDIVREANSYSTAEQVVSWLVLTSQSVDNLDTTDFSLTQLEGTIGATITGLTQLSSQMYRLSANVGTGNGLLIPNFVDNTSVLYYDSTISISNYTGELSIDGEPYYIRKNRPLVTLTSGTNAYVEGAFYVYMEFDVPITSFNKDLIGLDNARVVRVIEEEIGTKYKLEIKPIQQGTVQISVLEGAGITAGALLSLKSNTLVRVFKDYFPIIQTPLNIATGIQDISPSSLSIEEVIPNTAFFSSTEYPVGESSSLSVSGLIEQSGLVVENYNSVADLISPRTNPDWTIEFFLRINSTIPGTSRKAHILSIANSQGIAITASQGKLIISRNASQVSSLFAGINLPDRDTSTFIEWSDTVFSQRDKFPHIAITKKGSIYRFYLNGRRVGIISSPILFDITKGLLRVGYNPLNVSDVPYLLSNLRVTYGRALYTTYEINTPLPPYEITPNVTDFAEVLNFINIYSDNNSSSIARTGNTIKLEFSSIVNLPIAPVVTIQGSIVNAVLNSNTQKYISEYIITNTDNDGELSFSIKVPAQLGIEEKIFNTTSNNSFVVVDNTAMTVSITTIDLVGNSPTVDVLVTLSEPARSFTLDALVLVNCRASNLYKYPESAQYRISLQAISSGTFSVAINADSIVDLAGNGNNISNTLTLNASVPSYVPDPYWQYVICQLQPESTGIINQANTTNIVSNNNVLVTSDTSPTGLPKSMKFQGNSSLTLDIDSLPSSIEYTIECFLYISNSTRLALARPVLDLASNITAGSFNLSWSPVAGASYLLDIARDANFDTRLPGYTDKPVASTNYFANSVNSTATPLLQPVSYGSSRAFALSWDSSIANKELPAFAVEVALDSDFTKKLAVYSPAIAYDKYLIVGDVDTSLTKLNNTTSLPGNNVEVRNAPSISGSLLTGILKDSSGYPQLNYFLGESSIRLYGDNSYRAAGIIEDVELFRWQHVALVNRTRYTYLYIDGELVDRVYNLSFNNELIVGYNVGFFQGNITGLRITKGIARYKDSTYTVPSLPYPIS